MKRLVPKSKLKKIRFFKIRAARWAHDPEAIGISAEQVASLAAAAEEARVALTAQYAAQQTARSATLRLHNALAKMSNQGAGLVNLIRAHAKWWNDDGVYTRAFIPKPARPVPIEPPGTPFDLSTTLRAGGALALRWKCKHPRGAVGVQYYVSRSIAPGGRFELIGVAGEKKFIDETLPAGSSRVVYQIQAARSTGPGQAALFPVNFGGTGRPAPKLATYSTARPKRFRRCSA